MSEPARTDEPEAPAAGRTRTLSESESKELVSGFGVPVPVEVSATAAAPAAARAAEIGFPVVLKVNGANIAHKTERGLVRLGLTSGDDVAAVADELLAAVADEGDCDLIVAEMLDGDRELICGLASDPTFGMCVMVGFGGIFAEAISDVAFRLVPVDDVDAAEMLDDLENQALLGELRGKPAVDREALVAAITGLSRLAEARPDVVSVDLNPLLVVDGTPVAVDALVEVEVEAEAGLSGDSRREE